MELPDDVLRDLQKTMKYPMQCVLCGENTFNRGIFIPDERHRLIYGVTPGKAIVYGLCDNHSELTEETMNIVESRILETVRESKNFKSPDEFIEDNEKED